MKIRIPLEGLRKPLKHPVAQQIIRADDEFWIPVLIPDGVTTAAFDLAGIETGAAFQPATSIWSSLILTGKLRRPTGPL